ncbi:hypothetical protein [Virgibacillus sp. DJP39]|uniref:hypothetical protein n=1 Tax=Virgibacillus sp. DJP39 TaxID=3409790 RepID=UPI003BB5D266
MAEHTIEDIFEAIIKELSGDVKEVKERVSNLEIGIEEMRTEMQEMKTVFKYDIQKSGV